MQVRALDLQEQEGMSAEREWVNSLLNGVGSDVRLAGTRKDIPTLHTLLERGPFTDDAVGELELLGGMFGDVIAHEVGMSWVVIEDEDGTNFALQYESTSVFVFPRDMLVKRIEGGENPEEIDLDQMLSQIAEVVKEQAHSAGGA